MKKLIYSTIIFFSFSVIAFAGNPDRQGESGAGELLFNPWAVSAGLHTMGTSFTSGVASMRLNPAGIGRLNGKEFSIGNTRLYEGSEIQLNSFGYAQKAGENGAFGVSIASVDFGDIPITTESQPEGTGGSYSPSFFNIGLGYSYTYDNKISVGILFRGISEALPDLTSVGFAIDAGVQYVSGTRDNFKLGISLRNIGTPMKFSGNGLSTQVQSSGTVLDFQRSLDEQSDSYELPSALNIGASYDIYVVDDAFLRVVGNYTSNAFSLDQMGGGLEFHFQDIVVLRGGYKQALNVDQIEQANLYTGFAGGATFNVPFQKSKSQVLSIDYAYRTTSPFKGTHNFGVRLSF